MTNCSVTWTDKDGKLFCFSTEAAKKSFLSNPTEKLERAREFMAASNVEVHRDRHAVVHGQRCRRRW